MTRHPFTTVTLAATHVEIAVTSDAVLAIPGTLREGRNNSLEPGFHEWSHGELDMMRRLIMVLAVALVAAPALVVAGDRVEKDIAYSEAGGDRTRLDVYAPGDGKDHPVVIWVHGGAWQIGDKAHVQAKPRAFNERGYVLVSVNYRFHPAVTYKEQAGDIAQAIRWVHDHAGEYGGDPGRVFLMGHSAGAHLAALVGTDGRYLEKAGLKLSDLSGVDPPGRGGLRHPPADPAGVAAPDEGDVHERSSPRTRRPRRTPRRSPTSPGARASRRS